MAKKVIKKQAEEREYIIPLRRQWLKVPQYKRAKKAVKAIREFIAKHMRIPERNLKLVKIDKWLNEELWFRGIKKPPAKIKVKAVRDGDNIKVSLAEIPKVIQYKIARIEKAAKESEKKKAEKKALEKPKEEKAETEEETKEDKEKEEKEEAVKEAGKKAAEMQAKVEKHISKGKNVQVQRKALKK